MASIRIGNHRPQIIGVRNAATVSLWSSDSLFSLLAVMEKLSQEELLNFVWDGILQLVSSVEMSHYVVYLTIG